jgi:hypothetical protein
LPKYLHIGQPPTNLQCCQIAAGITPLSLSCDINTSLEVETQYGNERHLINYKIHIPSRSTTLLYIAFKYNQYKCVKYLINNNTSNLKCIVKLNKEDLPANDMPNIPYNALHITNLTAAKEFIQLGEHYYNMCLAKEIECRHVELTLSLLDIYNSGQVLPGMREDDTPYASNIWSQDIEFITLIYSNYIQKYR